MKKSKLVAVGLAGAVAAMMAGCTTRTQTADCVDTQGRVVTDTYCENSSPGYHWIYGGRVSTGYYGGYHHIYGGSPMPMSGANISSRSGYSISHGGGGFGGFGGFSRGGFGGAGDAHSGGGAHGGGG
jgi:hypothetical protein